MIEDFSACPENDSVTMREKARIFTKQDRRQLSEYQKAINTAAGEICIRNPTLLVNRGELLNLARDQVHKSGYKFKKGKSRYALYSSINPFTSADAILCPTGSDLLISITLALKTSLMGHMIE